jgi:MraZ protein
MSFRGSFEYSLDDRGRVAIPAKYRTEFPNNFAVITPSSDGCLQVYPLAAFEEMSEAYAKNPATTLAGRRSRRKFNADAFDAELDRQGRILIPAKLRAQASLNGAVVVVGNYECLEIWNPEAWGREREWSAQEEPSPNDQRREE